jgi:hypothetical protein
MNLSETSHGFFYIIYYLVSKFCLMFFASAAIGCLFGLVSALVINGDFFNLFFETQT